MRFHSSPIHRRRPRSRIRRLALLAFVTLIVTLLGAWLWTYGTEITAAGKVTSETVASPQHGAVRRAAPPKRGKVTFMNTLVKFLKGKEYLVFQTDNRLSRMMDYGDIPSNVSSFETSTYGPSILAISRWAKANNYAYLLVVSPTRMRHPFKFKSVSEFWKKPEALIFLQRAARKAGLKGVLYVDSDVVPHYQPLSLGALRRFEELRQQQQMTQAVTKENIKTIVIPNKISDNVASDDHSESQPLDDSDVAEGDESIGGDDEDGITIDDESEDDAETDTDDENETDETDEDETDEGEDDEVEETVDESDSDDDTRDETAGEQEEREEESNYDGGLEEERSRLADDTSEADPTVLDPCKPTKFSMNDQAPNIEQFLSVAAPNTSSYHIILPPGHPSTNAWLNQRLSYPYKFLTINAGAVMARTTFPAYRALREWYLDLIQKHIPFEATTAAFDIIHPSASHRMQVMRRIRNWVSNKQIFPPDRDLVDESVCTPHVSFRWHENRTTGSYKASGHFRCRGANMTMMQDLWSNTICNSTIAEKMFKLKYIKSEKEEVHNGTVMPAMARIKCKRPTIKFTWHIYKGWPGDQSRLQWLVYLDHMRKTNVFHIPTDPMLSCMDGRVPLRNRLLYHAGGREAKRLMGQDYTKLMMQQDLQMTAADAEKGLCDAEWRHNWFERAWKEISQLPAVRFTSNRRYRGTFNAFEENIWKNRQPITLFNIPQDSIESRKGRATPPEESGAAKN